MIIRNENEDLEKQVSKFNRNNKFLILGFLLIGMTLISSAQVISSGNISSINYSSPKGYTIGGITVTGIKYLDQDVLINISGLKVGEKIQIPGETVTKAIEKLWKQGLFSDVKVLASKIIEDRILLRFS